MLLKDISNFRFSDSPCVVVLTNLCMGMGLQRRTLDNLLRWSNFKRMVCITPFPHVRLKLAGTVKVSCTWAKMSSWLIYDVLTSEQAKQLRKFPEPTPSVSSSLPLLRSSSAPSISRAERIEQAIGRLHPQRRDFQACELIPRLSSLTSNSPQRVQQPHWANRMRKTMPASGAPWTSKADRDRVEQSVDRLYPGATKMHPHRCNGQASEEPEQLHQQQLYVRIRKTVPASLPVIRSRRSSE